MTFLSFCRVDCCGKMSSPYSSLHYQAYHLQRPHSLSLNHKFGNGSVATPSSANDVFLDEQEDQIVPDCSIMAPGKLGDLSPLNEPSNWLHQPNAHNMHLPLGGCSETHTSSSEPSGQCHSTGFLSTAVHFSLQEVR